MKNWYAVYSKPHKEPLAEENLQRQGFEVYLPRCKPARGSRIRWRDRIEPLFPRYLFVRMDPEQQNAGVLRSTKGVIGLVRFGDRLGVVPESFMDRLVSSCDAETGLHPLKEKEMRTGDRVVVTDGVFAGRAGGHRHREPDPLGRDRVAGGRLRRPSV